jgi:signal transduction histidine kinase
MLSEVTKAASAGVYQPAMEVEGNDELGQFGRAFNRMIVEILGRDLEIRRWNEELLQRVDKRTSELREAENQILRARRLAALGSLGAGIAHELNNPLTAIIGLVTIAKRELGDSPQVKVLEVVLEQTRRVARVIADLRQLTAAEAENAGKCFQLVHPIRVALQGCAQDLHDHGINLQIEFPSALPEIQGNPEQIRTMVVHLITNAINAMPQGGKLEVGVHAVENEAIRFWIRDTGKGIPPMLLERIFDPFFTTKDYPSQLGMGLSICHAIVEAHHGKISVESIVGAGTTFYVLFPIAAPHGHLY